MAGDLVAVMTEILDAQHPLPSKINKTTYTENLTTSGTRVLDLAAGQDLPATGRLHHRRSDQTQEMLDFCAEHSIEPEIELIDIAAINDAWDRVLASDVRYRFVIDTTSLRDGG